jgi:ribosomal protein S17E
MGCPDFQRRNEQTRISDKGTRQTFLIELIDMLKDHHEAALRSKAYVMREVEEKLRHTLDIIEHIYDKYEVEFGSSFSFYMKEIEDAHRYRTSDMDRQRIAGYVSKPGLPDATGHP